MPTSVAAASASLCRRLDPAGPRQPGHGRHGEARRMDEGEQLQQVEPGHIGIAEALADQRRVEDDMRRLGQPGDRLAPRRLAHLAARGDPDAGMGCMEGGKRQRSGHDA